MVRVLTDRNRVSGHSRTCRSLTRLHSCAFARCLSDSIRFSSSSLSCASSSDRRDTDSCLDVSWNTCCCSASHSFSIASSDDVASLSDASCSQRLRCAVSFVANVERVAVSCRLSSPWHCSCSRISGSYHTKSGHCGCYLRETHTHCHRTGCKKLGCQCRDVFLERAHTPTSLRHIDNM